MRRWPLILFALLVIGGGIGFMIAWQAPDAPIANRIPIGGPFALQTADGARFTEKDTGGKPFAVFFGFTFCPDVCPTTLSDLSALMAELGPAGQDFRAYFISVDPERDTPKALKDYVAAFDPRIIPLTGTEAEIEAAARAYKVFVRRIPQEGGGYTMDHTASIFLMRGDGSFAGTLDFHEPRDVALAKLRKLLGN